MPAIFLLGFMCSGKTTLGRALAERLGTTFTDLDQAIEKSCGSSVAEIFSTEGEDGFISIERDTLLEVLSGHTDGVIALGGGTPCRPGVMEMLNSLGITVWLQPGIERLIQRLMLGKDSRPLIRDIGSEAGMLNFVLTKMEERVPFYSLSRYRFDSSFLENEEEIEISVTDFIRKIL